MTAIDPSGLWEDRRGQDDGPGLHALIIGVSDYQFLPQPGQFPEKGRVTLNLTKVNITARSAFRIAQWLKEKYWHPTIKVRTIRLLLSPSQEEISGPDNAAMAAASAATLRATWANVWTALQAWQKDCVGKDNMSVLYAAGHGIQWGSRDDAIVLLEDFAADQMFLDPALDIGKTMRGMAGDDMPQVQFYFADACRIQPDEYSKYFDAGSPLRLQSKNTGPDLRAAPIFYAACPQTTAVGNSATGTYFSNSLIECLDLYAFVGPKQDSCVPVATEYWHVSVNSLYANLPDRTSELAGKDHQKQDVVVGGNGRPAVFCAALAPPTVTLELDVSPDDEAKKSFAELWSSNMTTCVHAAKPCLPRPLALDPVPVGLYIVQVLAEPRVLRYTQAVQVLPPITRQQVRLTQ